MPSINKVIVKNILLVFAIFVFLYIVSFQYGIDPVNRNPAQSLNIFGQQFMFQPAGGLSQWEMKHPYFSPSIFIYGDVVNQYQYGYAMWISIFYWFVISMLLVYTFNKFKRHRI